MTPPSRTIQPVLYEFARELRCARIHARLSKQKLARKAGMTRYGLAKIEKGGNVTLGTIALLANALGYQVADLFPRKRPWE